MSATRQREADTIGGEEIFGQSVQGRALLKAKEEYWRQKLEFEIIVPRSDDRSDEHIVEKAAHTEENSRGSSEDLCSDSATDSEDAGEDESNGFNLGNNSPFCAASWPKFLLRTKSCGVGEDMTRPKSKRRRAEQPEVTAQPSPPPLISKVKGLARSVVNGTMGLVASMSPRKNGSKQSKEEDRAGAFHQQNGEKANEAASSEEDSTHQLDLQRTQPVDELLEPYDVEASCADCETTEAGGSWRKAKGSNTIYCEPCFLRKKNHGDGEVRPSYATERVGQRTGRKIISKHKRSRSALEAFSDEDPVETSDEEEPGIPVIATPVAKKKRSARKKKKSVKLRHLEDQGGPEQPEPSAPPPALAALEVEGDEKDGEEEGEKGAGTNEVIEEDRSKWHKRLFVHKIKGYPKGWPVEVIPARKMKDVFKNVSEALLKRLQSNKTIRAVQYFGTMEYGIAKECDINPLTEFNEEAMRKVRPKHKAYQDSVTQAFEFARNPKVKPIGWWNGPKFEDLLEPADEESDAVEEAKAKKEKKERNAPHGGNAKRVNTAHWPSPDKLWHPPPNEILPFRLPEMLAIRAKPKYKCVKRNVYSGTEQGSQEKPKKQPREDILVCTCEKGMGCGSSDIMEQEMCINKTMNVRCCHINCPNGKDCKNKEFNLMKQRKLKPFLTKSCGWGVKTKERIQKGDFVIEYAGEIISDEECERRMWDAKARHERNFYMMEISSDAVIDARHKANISRLINSSCQPNCRSQKCIDASTGEVRVGIFALRDIEVDEELSYNYQFEHFAHGQKEQDLTSFDCRCGAPNCIGSLDSTARKREEIKENMNQEISVKWENGKWLKAKVTDYSWKTQKYAIEYEEDGTIEHMSLDPKGKIKFKYLRKGKIQRRRAAPPPQTKTTGEGGDGSETGSAKGKASIGAKITPWTDEEHRLYLVGLEKYGKGKWKDISAIVKTRTGKQCCSHYQGILLRKNKGKTGGRFDEAAPEGGAQVDEKESAGPAATEALTDAGPVDEKKPMAKDMKNKVGGGYRSGSWSPEEHKAFLLGLEKHSDLTGSKLWKAVSAFVKTRDQKSCANHQSMLNSLIDRRKKTNPKKRKKSKYDDMALETRSGADEKENAPSSETAEAGTQNTHTNACVTPRRSQRPATPKKTWWKS